jgi:hypothetical protein
METLTYDTVKFVAKNLQEILSLPIDMNCMNSTLIKKLASYVSIDDLDTLKDKKDKLSSKLYMKKLELLFEEETNMLSRCVYCN